MDYGKNSISEKLLWKSMCTVELEDGIYMYYILAIYANILNVYCKMTYFILFYLFNLFLSQELSCS